MDPLKIRETIPGKPEEVFNHWFSPKQVLPPLKKFVKVDFKIGGEFSAILQMGPNEILCSGVFRDIVPHTRIVFDWTAMGNTLALSMDFIPDGRANKVTVELYQSSRGNITPEMVQMVTMYLAMMKAIFTKQAKDDGLI